MRSFLLQGCITALTIQSGRCVSVVFSRYVNPMSLPLAFTHHLFQRINTTGFRRSHLCPLLVPSNNEICHAFTEILRPVCPLFAPSRTIVHRESCLFRIGICESMITGSFFQVFLWGMPSLHQALRSWTDVEIVQRSCLCPPNLLPLCVSYTHYWHW